MNYTIELIQKLGFKLVTETKKGYVGVKLDSLQNPLFGIWRKVKDNNGTCFFEKWPEKFNCVEPWFSRKEDINNWSFLWALRLGRDVNSAQLENRCNDAVTLHISNTDDAELLIDCLCASLEQSYGMSK